MGLGADDIKIDLTSDRMEASIELLNAESEFTFEDLISALSAKGITFGIDNDKLKKIAAEPQFNVPLVIACGQKAVDGKNEEIEYKFTTGDQPVIKETDSGTLDFRSISNFVNIKAGEMLAVKTPATDGESGSTVTGDELKARDGKKINLRVGKGVKVSEDGWSATAEVDGHACLLADRITVQNTVEVPENVDYSVGNIKFIGSVHIRGNVMPDFSVEAEGNIEIDGNVEKAVIRCGGNLAIRGIVFGQGECVIEAGGDAEVGAIDQAEVRVRKSLIVANYVRHSNVSVGGDLIVKADKGNIVGGDIHCFRKIDAPFIGNSMATLTKLTVGTNPFISHEIESLQTEFYEADKKLTQVRTALSTLASRADSGQESDKTSVLKEKLLNTRQQLEPLLEKLQAQIAESQEKSTEFKEAKIKVSQVIYPGVIISFRDRMQYKTQDEQQALSFYEEESEIRTGPY
jgi:uncharacterized protein (DUF342 family)